MAIDDNRLVANRSTEVEAPVVDTPVVETPAVETLQSQLASGGQSTAPQLGPTRADLPTVITSETLKEDNDIVLPDFGPEPVPRINTDIVEQFKTPDQPAPTTKETPTVESSFDKFLQEQEEGGGRIDTSDIRADLGIERKRKASKAIENSMLLKQQRYQAQIEALEKNPEGVFGGALASRINKLSQEASRDLAKDAIAFKIINDDYNGAVSTFEDRKADMKDDRDFLLRVQQLRNDALKDDLTEKEKIDLNFKNDKELKELDQANKLEEQGLQSDLVDGQAQTYVDSITSGQFSPSDINKFVPKEAQSAVWQKLNETGYVDPADSQATSLALQKVGFIQDIFDNPALGSAVGPNPFARASKSELFTSKRANVVGNIENLISKETLDTLINLKKAGGTLGALSDQERVLLQNAASAINNFAIEENGKIVGYKTTEANFKLELKKLQNATRNLILFSPSSDIETKKNILASQILEGDPSITNKEDLSEAVNLVLPNYLSPGQGSSFSQVGNTTASNVPQRNNNPGNIKSGGLADEFATGTDEQGHLIFPDVETGFKAMTEDVQAKISGNSRHIGANPTITELGSVYAEDPNWGKAVASILGLDPNTRTETIPIETLVKAIARQEGFNA